MTGLMGGGRAVGWREGIRIGRVLTGRHPAGTGALVLGYHGVHDGACGYHVTAAELRRQLRQVRDAGFRFVPLRTLVELLREGRDIDRCCAVTFDDGFADVIGNALPVLAQDAVPATVFLVTARPGSPPRWWPGQTRTLTPAEASELARQPGVDIGSHTHCHASLPRLSDDDLLSELTRSRDALEQWTGRRVSLLAYPHGHHDHRVRAAARDVGYVGACTFRNGRLVGGDDPYLIPRMTMQARHGRLRWADHLSRPPTRWPDTQVASELGHHGAGRASR